MSIDINVLLDRSGSMQSRKTDHEGGLISFIKDNQDMDASFTFIQFDGDNPFEILLDEVDIKSIDINNIKLLPRGSTPLYDAIGRTVALIEKRNNEKLKIIFIVSDGENNSSVEWSGKMVKESIAKHPDWKFLFLGTNQDAIQEGENFGIARGSTMNYVNSSNGINNVYQATSRSTRRMYNATCQGLNSTEALMAGDYNEEDRVMCADGDINLTITPESK